MRLFGTNGIREVVGERLTPEFAVAVAEAIGHELPPGPAIVLGRDGRTSSAALSGVVAGVLALSGHAVTDVGVLPTPAIQLSVRELGAQFGVIITASHNPPEFNGIKCISADGLEVLRSVEESIEASVAAGRARRARFDAVGPVRAELGGAKRYIARIVGLVDAAAIARRRLRVVLDCGNGASAVTSPELLRRLGCEVVSLNAHIDGRFPGHLSEPTPENLADLTRIVPAIGADLGIAHDGDADRAVFVTAQGEYVPGEKTLTLLARELVRRSGGGVVVTPVTASLGVEEAVRPYGGQVVYTRVGSPSVTRAMAEHRAVFGGEENGGLIFPELQLARDGAMTAAAVIDLLARREASLSDAIADLPRYTLIKEKVACPADRHAAVLQRLGEEAAASGRRTITIDGVKVFESDGWLLMRPSGTEPLIRVFAESADPRAARRLADDGVSRVQAAVSASG